MGLKKCFCFFCKNIKERGQRPFRRVFVRRDKKWLTVFSHSKSLQDNDIYIYTIVIKM